MMRHSATGSMRPMPVVGIGQRDRLLQPKAVFRGGSARPARPAPRAYVHGGKLGRWSRSFVHRRSGALECQGWDIPVVRDGPCQLRLPLAPDISRLFTPQARYELGWPISVRRLSGPPPARLLESVLSRHSETHRRLNRRQRYGYSGHLLHGRRGVEEAGPRGVGGRAPSIPSFRLSVIGTKAK